MRTRLVLALLLAGCETTPEPTRFELACAAAAGAFRDEAVTLGTEDCSRGEIRGRKEGIDVSANLRTLPNGSVRVEFHTSGSDQALIHRISRAYDRRMGR